jgi:hypothetical protein
MLHASATTSSKNLRIHILVALTTQPLVIAIPTQMKAGPWKEVVKAGEVYDPQTAVAG